MATKPTDTFTWATDTNYTTAPDTGTATKVNPTGWPAVAEGFIPGTGAIAVMMNKVLNVLGQWTGWLNSGSSAGVADAHIIESDSVGKVRMQWLQFIAGKLLDLSVGSQIANTSDNLTLDPADGQIREFEATSSAARDHEMRNAGAAGRFILFTNPGGNSHAITIRRSGFSGSYIVELPATPTDDFYAALLYDDGSNWRLGIGMNCSPGTDA